MLLDICFGDLAFQLDEESDASERHIDLYHDLTAKMTMSMIF